MTAIRLSSNRSLALDSVRAAPDGYIVTIKAPTRSLDQNALLWPLLDAVSKQVDWYGRKLSTDSWKHIFSSALFKQEVVPGLDGGFVVLGQSTSKFTKSQFSNLIDIICAFANERGVKLPASPHHEAMQ